MALDPTLAGWLEASANGLDLGETEPAPVLPRLAEARLFRIGVPAALSGDGGGTADAVEAIAAVSELSLAAGFVFWGHRAFIEYLAQSSNAGLAARLLPPLFAGETAGATGLSNAMKFLAGIEELQITAREEQGGYRVDGKLPWVTNLRPEGFHVAAAVSRGAGKGAFVASIASGQPGVARSSDLELMALRSTNTAAIALEDVRVEDSDVVAEDAHAWLPQARPAFLGLQCGMSIGLARRALRAAREAAGAGRNVLSPEIDDVSGRLSNQQRSLRAGLADGGFVAKPAALFRIRIALAEAAADAVALELQATGGKCYLTKSGAGFARRWREAAFLPVITPSLVQLKTALAAQAEAGRAA